jgi:hypothetical protein
MSSCLWLIAVLKRAAKAPGDAALTTISRRPSLPGDDSRSTCPQLLLNVLLNLLCLLVVDVVRGVGTL